MPFNIQFPKFNPGTSLTSTPYKQQVIGSPENAVNLAKAALPVKPAAAIPPANQPIKPMSILDIINAQRPGGGGMWRGQGARGSGLGSGNRGGYTSSGGFRAGGIY